MDQIEHGRRHVDERRGCRDLLRRDAGTRDHERHGVAAMGAAAERSLLHLAYTLRDAALGLSAAAGLAAHTPAE